MTTSPNGNDTKIIHRKLILIENKSLRLISEVSILLCIYIQSLSFRFSKQGCFHYSTLEFLMTAQGKILMINAIRTAM